MSKLYPDNRNANINLVKQLSKNCYYDNDVMADLMATQAVLEGGLLNTPPSELALKYNNCFGIKGRGTHNPSSVLLDTEEHYASGWVTVHQQFAWNNDLEDSFEQRKKLFQNGTSDDPSRYKNLFTASTFEEVAAMVKQDGYATDPSYTQELIEVYNKWIKSSEND